MFLYQWNLPSKSFLLSLLIHMAIFSSFIFIIPKMRESKKTKMVFLGQILTTHDTDKSNILKRKKSINIPYKISVKTNIDNGNIPYSTSIMGKPPIDNSITPNKKINMKSVFYTSDKNKKQTDYKKSIDKIDKYFKQEKYHHLKLPE